MQCAVCQRNVPASNLADRAARAIQYRLTIVMKNAQPSTFVITVCRACEAMVTEVEFRSNKVR